MSNDPVHPPDLRSACRSGRAIFLLLAAFLLGLTTDLLLKHWAFANLGPEPVDIPAVLHGLEPLPHNHITLVPGVLSLKLTLNTGAVFGLWSGYRIMFILATALAVGVVAWFFCASRARQWVVHIALGMVLAGAMGNLYDRWEHHAVRDMLWLFPDVMLPFGLAWPGGIRDVYPWIFNIADVLLLVGIAVLLIRSFLPDPVPRPAPSSTNADSAH
jgi:signal peptidase II